MSALIQFLVGHGAMFLGGTTCLLLAGAFAVLAARTPIHRQRTGEMAILAALVWLILACLPLPRPTSWFWPDRRPVPAVAEKRSAGQRRQPDATRTNGLDSQHAGQPSKTPPVGAWDPSRGNNSRTRLDSKTHSPSRMNQKRSHTAATGRAISSPAAASWEIAHLLAAAYLVGVCGWLVWLVLGRILLRRLVRTASVAEEWLQQLYSELPIDQRTNRPRLLVSKRCQRACSFGSWRATIVLPHSLCQPNRTAALRHVLQHELAHVEQGDAWGRLLFNLALPVLYIHPLFWWIRAKTYFAAELIADDRAAAKSSSREAYANELIGLVKQFGGQTRTQWGIAGVFNSPTQFYRRMEMLMQRGSRLATSCSLTWRSVGFVLFALVVVAFAGAMGLPPLRAKDVPSESTAVPKSGQQNPRDSTLIKNVTKTSKAASKSPLQNLKKEDLRYDGKSFNEWQRDLKTELKLERRIEGFKAMAAFGRRGYGEAAARTIVELAQEYNVQSAYTDNKVTAEAAKAIRLIGAAAVPVLVEALNDENVYARRFAAKAFSYSRGTGFPWAEAKAAVPALVKTLKKKDEDTYVREKSIDAVAELDPRPHAESTIQAFLAVLKDNNVGIRHRAILHLQGAEPHADLVVPALSQALQDDDPNNRELAARVLTHFGPKARSAEAALIQAVKDKNDGVRQGAIYALGEIGADANVLVPALIEALKDKYQNQYQNTRDRALRLLAKLGPAAKDAVPNLIELYPEVRSSSRVRVITTLGNIGADARAALPLLGKLLQDKDTKVSNAAAAALRKIAK